MATDYDDLRAILPGLSPVAMSGVDPDEVLASNDPQRFLAQRSGMTQNTTPMPPPVPNELSQLAAATGQPSQTPATNAPNPPSGTTRTPAVPATVTPTGRATSPVSPTAAPDPNAIESRFVRAQASASADNPTGVPIQRDPNHPEYMPSAGRRIARGFLAAGEGLARGGFRGALLGALNPAEEGATPYGAGTRQFSAATQRNAMLQDSLKQQLGQSATNAETALKNAQAQGAALIEITPEIASELGSPGLSGERLTQGAFQKILSTAKTVTGRSDVADTKADSAMAVQKDKDAAIKGLRDAQTEEADAKAELARAGNDPSSPAYKLAVQRARTASANASAAQIRANAYALNATAGNLGTTPSGEQIEGGATSAAGKPIGSRFAAPYIKQEGRTAQFNDVLGATDNIEKTAENLVKAGKKLNDPQVVAAIADPKSTSLQWAQGQFATSGLTPAQRDYVTNVKAYRENLQALRQSAGGGVSDAQVNRLMEMAPGAGTPDLDYLKRQTSQIRQTAGRLSEGLPKMKGGHAVRTNANAPGAEGPPAEVVQAAREGQYLHGPNGEVYRKVNGEAVKQ